MSIITGTKGQLLEVTVVGCSKLKDSEWVSTQDPYVCIEYATTKYRTRTCTGCRRNPTFQEKFVFTLTEGLRKFNVVVWNSNNITYDELIGSGKIQLEKVLYHGYDDNAWPLLDKKDRHAGDVRIIMQDANGNVTHQYSQPPPLITAYPGITYSLQPPPPYPQSAAAYQPPPPYPRSSPPPPPPPYTPLFSYPPPPLHDPHYYYPPRTGLYRENPSWHVR